MQDLERLGKALFDGEKGEALRNIAQSEAARGLEARLDAAAVERAARSGSTAALQSILSEVLATEEGRALARELSRLGF